MQKLPRPTRRAFAGLAFALLQACERTPEARLRDAAFKGDIDGVKRALRDGASVDSTAVPGAMTALLGACYFETGSRIGHTEVVKLLIASGANVNYRDGHGFTPLIIAALVQPQVVPMFLQAGVNPNEQLPDGSTALMYASQNGDLDTVRALLKYHANIKLVNYHGDTAIDIARRFNHPEVATLLKVEMESLQ